MPRSIFSEEIKFFSLLDDTSAMGLDSMADGIAPDSARADNAPHVAACCMAKRDGGDQ